MRGRSTAVALCLAACAADEERCLDGEAVWGDASPETFCVEGDLVLGGHSWDEIERLHGLVEVRGSFVLQDDPQLVELPVFPALRQVGGSLSVAGNDELVAVRGFPALETVGGELYVGDNGRLSSFTLGASALDVGSVFFALNHSLTELRLPLTRVEEDLRILSHDHLVTLAMPALAEVGGDFFVADNPRLEAADFTALRTTRAWTLSSNERLASLAGFSALAEVSDAAVLDNDALTELRWSASVAGSLTIGDNAELVHIDGDTAPGPFTLRVGDNVALTRITGFSAVRILDELWIGHNPALRELAGLASLESVGGLKIATNLTLSGPESLLPALREVTGDLAIYGNPRLPLAVVDGLLSRVHVTGATRVGDNEDQMTELDPCPWPMDGVCDEPSSWQGAGTGLCVMDPEDCEPIQPP